MNTAMTGLRRVMAVLVSASLLLSAAACTSAPAKAGGKVAAGRVSADLERVYAVGQPVRVGPFEIEMTRANLVTSPVGTRKLAWQPELKKGTAQADIAVRITNPQSPDSKDATAVETGFSLEGTVRLEDSTGKVLPGFGFGMSPPPPLPGEPVDPHSTVVRLNYPIAPGQSMALYPQYVVPLDSKSLTLFVTPIASRPDLVVKFKVK